MHNHQISQSPLHLLPPQSAHPCRLSSLCRTYQANKICHCRINNNRNTFFSNLKKKIILSQPCIHSFMKECTWMRSRKHFTTAFFYLHSIFPHSGEYGVNIFFYLYSLFSHSGEYGVNKGKKKNIQNYTGESLTKKNTRDFYSTEKCSTARHILLILLICSTIYTHTPTSWGQQ